MLEKMFTTKMCIDKKKLQNRFSKIRSENGKTSKLIATAVFAVIIASIICVSIWVAVSRQDDKIVYKNEKMNIQFEIPNDWRGKYIIDETLEDDGYIIIKHKEIAGEYEGAGILCSVYKEPDETVDATLNALGNQTVVWRNQDYAYIVGRPTDVQHPIWTDSDEEDSALASEYEKMSKGITHIEATFRLIKVIDTPDIVNVENLSYAQIRDLQRQVNNGHFPWRLDYEQVIQMYLSGMNIDVAGGKIIEFAGDGEKCSASYYVDGNTYSVELFKPIDKSKYGIWIVRTYKKANPATISEVFFYEATPTQKKIEKQADGWYKLPSVVNVSVQYEGLEPESVTAYFTPAGTETEEYKIEVGKIEAPFEYMTSAKALSVNIQFPKDATLGHLNFIFEFENGAAVKSELYNILAEH